MDREVLDWSEGFPMMVGPWQLGHTDPTPETREFWAGVRREQLLFKRCGDCSAPHHPRRIICFACGSESLGWEEASGNATVYTYSVVSRGPTESFQARTPYCLGIVELDEGPFFFTDFPRDVIEQIDIGTRVEFAVSPDGLPTFIPGDD